MCEHCWFLTIPPGDTRNAFARYIKIIGLLEAQDREDVQFCYFNFLITGSALFLQPMLKELALPYLVRSES